MATMSSTVATTGALVLSPVPKPPHGILGLGSGVEILGAGACAFAIGIVCLPAVGAAIVAGSAAAIVKLACDGANNDYMTDMAARAEIVARDRLAKATP